MNDRLLIAAFLLPHAPRELSGAGNLTDPPARWALERADSLIEMERRTHEPN